MFIFSFSIFSEYSMMSQKTCAVRNGVVCFKKLCCPHWVRRTRSGRWERLGKGGTVASWGGGARRHGRVPTCSEGEERWPGRKARKAHLGPLAQSPYRCPPRGKVAQPCPTGSGSQAVRPPELWLFNLSVPVFKMGVVSVSLSCKFVGNCSIRLRT